MIMVTRALLLLSVILAAAPAASADIAGRVTLKGTPKTPDEVIKVSGDRRCNHEGDLRTERWKVGPDGGLADVVVSVRNFPVTAVRPEEKKPLIDQIGCQYVPHVTAIVKNGVITVRNSDPTLHNVHGIEFTGKGKRGKDLFNVGQPVQGMSTDRKFPETGVVRIICDVHPWMLTWVVILDTPFHAVTDAKGNFQLPPGLPDGEYEVHAWHHQFPAVQKQMVRLEQGKGTAAIEFDAELAQ